jgi:hypothetical protein
MGQSWFCMRRSSRARVGAAFVATLTASAASASAALPPAGYSIMPIGLRGAGYTWVSNTGTLSQQTRPVFINSSAQVVGESSRYTPSGVQRLIGHDVWLQTGATTIQLGFVGGAYEYLSLNGAIGRNSLALGLNDAGQVIGLTNRFNVAGQQNGQDGWLYSGGTVSRIGLSGVGYEGTEPGGVLRRYSNPSFLNNAGQVAGGSSRVTPDGLLSGHDAWIYSGGSTQIVGLLGAGYELGNGRSTFVGGMNASGQLAGHSMRYGASTTLGNDAWLRTGSAYTLLPGLTNGAHQVTIGANTYHNSITVGLSNSGYVIGTSELYSSTATSLGLDAWVSNGTTTVQVNPTGGYYESTDANGTARFGTPRAVNNAGMVVGDSGRYGPVFGPDAWIYDGTQTRSISPTGGLFEYSDADGTHSSARPKAISDAGQVIGSSTIYTVNSGTSGLSVGWFYDDDTRVTTPLIFATGPGGAAESSAEYLSNDGLVLGYFRTNPGVGGQVINHGFAWSVDGGFHDLGDLVAGGLSGTDWSFLAAAYVAGGESLNLPGFPKAITGVGHAIGGGGTAFLMTAIAPEPASFSGLLMVTLLGRRRRG